MIPAEVFLPIVERLMEQDIAEDEYDPAYTRIKVLAARCNLRHDSLYRAFQREALPFDLCDLILSKLGATHLWWFEPLAELYATSDDNRTPFTRSDEKKRCARPGCENLFVPSSFVKEQKYCGKGCQQAHWIWKKRGRGKRADSYRVGFVCKNGHEFSPENTYIKKDGARMCRRCRTENSRVYRQRAKMLVAA